MVAGGPSDRLVRAAAVAALLTLGLAMGVAHFLQPGRTEFLGPGPAAAAILEVALAAVLFLRPRASPTGALTRPFCRASSWRPAPPRP